MIRLLASQQSISYKKSSPNKIEFILLIIFLISMYFDMSDSGVFYHKIFLIFILGLIYIIKNKKVKYEINIFIYMIFTLLICFSGVYAQNNETALGNIVTVITCLILMITMSNIIGDNDNLEKLIRVIIILAFILSLRVILVTDYDRLFNGIYYPDVVLKNKIGNRNLIAMMIAIGLNFSLYSIFSYRKKINLIYCIVMFIAIALTGSRKGLLIAVLPFTLTYLFKFLETKSILKKIKILISLSILCIVTLNIIMNVDFIYDTVGFRIESIYREFVYGEKSDEGSFNTRKDMVNKGLEYFADRPLLGYGVSNYRYLYYQDTGNETYSHNNYIELLVNNGIIGLIIYYSFYLSVIINANKKRLKSNSIKEKNYYMFVTCILISMLIMDTGLVSYNFYTTYILMALAMKSLQVHDIKNCRYNNEVITK